MTHDWNWPVPDEGRVKRAGKVKVLSLDLEGDEPSILGLGESSGEEYFATFYGCTCPDFAIKKKAIACKHMLRLAMEAHILDVDGLTPSQARARRITALRQRIAEAYGMYHLFHAPAVTDAEYDAMKQSLADLEAQD